MFKKLKEHYLESATILADKVTKIILKKEDYIFAIQNIDQIDTYFEYFINKFKEINENLYNSHIYIDYDNEPIKEQIEIYIETKKKYSFVTDKNKFNKLKPKNLKKYKKIINKWRGLSILIEEMPKLLLFYNTFDIDKDINEEEINQKLKESEIFKNSFNYYEKNGYDNSKQFGSLHN